MDSFTETGATVRHSPISTAIGDDRATINNFNNALDTGNGHNVIVHGSRPTYDEVGGIPVVNDNPTHIQQITEAVLSNPDYVQGTPICFGSCWSGSSGTAQELANSLGVPVLAPTRPVSWNSRNQKWIMDTDPSIADKWDYRTEFPLTDIELDWKKFLPTKSEK